MKPEIYTEFGKLYDAIYGKSADNVLNFFEWFFEDIGLHPENHDQLILDMGAGTGRLLIPLTQKGYSIIGYEPFENLIKQAKLKSSKQGVDIDINMGSFQTLDDNSRFYLIFGINSTMAYLGEIEEWQDAFNRIFQSLIPGGYFLLDLMNFFALIKNYRSPELVEFDHDEYRGNFMINHQVDLENSKWIHDMVVFLEDETKHITRINDKHELTMVNLRELQIYAKNSGLKFKYYLNSFEDRLDDRKQGMRMILLFQKPLI